MAQTKNRAPPRRSPNRRRSQRPRTQSRVSAARRTVEGSAKDASQSVGKAASKAKTPLLAGGAAIAGAAGGLAVGAMRSRQSHANKVLGVKVPRPKRVKLRSRDVATAAKELGSFSQNVGELATELRHAREATGAGNNKRRSPVEVVLEGLTTRR